MAGDGAGCVQEELKFTIVRTVALRLSHLSPLAPCVFYVFGVGIAGDHGGCASHRARPGLLPCTGTLRRSPDT